MQLSILIPTIYGREQKLISLTQSLSEMGTDGIEIVVLKDNREKTIGQKRNELLCMAKGEYTVFVDDDDQLPTYYLSEIRKALQQKPDVVGFKGNYYHNGTLTKEFVHSVKYKSYKENMYYYLRPPNHLNPIKASISKQFLFKKKSMYEDADWSMSLSDANVLREEIYLDKIMYNYFYVSKK